MFNPFTWLSGIFSKFQATIGDFLKGVFSAELTLVIAKLKGPAIEIVKDLMDTDLTNAQKRADALKQLTQAAKELGLDVGKSALNLLIEMALQYVKNLK
jgi:hypothetical protein